MNKIYLILAFIVFPIVSTYSQTIEIEKSFLKHYYSQDDVDLKIKELLPLLENNSDSYALIKSAKSNLTFSNVLVGVSAGFFTYPLVIDAFDNNNVSSQSKYVLPIIGLGTAILSVVVRKNSYSKAEKAIQLYNSNIKPTSNISDLRFELVTNDKGIGLMLCF